MTLKRDIVERDIVERDIVERDIVELRGRVNAVANKHKLARR